ncbi:hypothetical protein C1637_23865 [Chryseobacterium lactis]|uniref:Beta-lactamase-inhibitor-like PepSY-like domain-containing protein n=1 Tax=Chryseobacterium lactis TaxID=1241981 RepID=A0A3G6RF47_CHRLC|nr:hypothetical protein [Chryseobacterium lactis]AZA83288.1 hypothetical protein EG342_16005 [Chryseobacterium lactis]AZB03672.1 hypothetical protein EG341_06875 [Chryseobacterium lactis]PNW11118.1 hypothetical protein C1637_23865 [Chryseobacterium lactis]
MKIKPLTLFLTVLFQLLSVTAFSQKTADLHSLLNKNSEFIFPQTPDKISKALHAKTIFYEDANDEKYAKWITATGLELYCSLGKNNVINEMSFDVPDHKVLAIEGLPYGLVLNKTTLQQAKTTFSKYNTKTQKLGDDSEFSGGSKLVFKKGNHYTILLFDAKNLLKSIGITTELVDPAAN